MKALYPMQFSYLQSKEAPNFPASQKPDSAARHARYKPSAIKLSDSYPSRSIPARASYSKQSSYLPKVSRSQENSERERSKPRPHEPTFSNGATRFDDEFPFLSSPLLSSPLLSSHHSINQNPFNLPAINQESLTQSTLLIQRRACA